MTMIVGFNLASGIYLAGDTRVSRLEGNEIKVVHDNIQKVEHLCGSGQKQVLSAVAGSAHFANYLIDKIRKSDLADSGIANLSNNIEDFLAPLVHDYFVQYGNSSAVILFAGADATSRKIINGKKWEQLAVQARNSDGNIFVNEVFGPMIRLGEKVLPYNTQLEINNTMLFALSINSSGIYREDAEWGEYLLYGQGAGLVKSQIAEKDFHRLEFEIPNQGVDKDSANFSLLYAIVAGQAHKLGLKSVGNTVVALQQLHTGESIALTGRAVIYDRKDTPRLLNGESVTPIQTSETEIIGGVIHRIENGNAIPLELVGDYIKSDDNSLII